MIGWWSVAVASEGMWLPEQVAARAAELQQAGIEVPAGELADPAGRPLGAIVSVGGFCSGSFVSADGLVATNRHCVDEFLQHTSTPTDDRVTDGFLAPSRAEEAAGGPSAKLYLLESSTDVTDKVRSVIDAASTKDEDRVAQVDRVSSGLVQRCEADRVHRCDVVPQYGGATWQLLRYRELRDVRVVYAPPTDVAYFGGDADNFEWPRHDADVALLRAYVAPNGKTADPSPKNVPFRPSTWLSIDPGGAQPGEPVIVAGFPGQTERYALPESLVFQAERELPADLAWVRLQLRLAAEAGAASEEGRTKLGSLILELENERKYLEGMLDGVRATPVLELKRATVDAFLKGQPLSATPSPAARALAVLQRLEIDRQGQWARRDALGHLLGSDLASLGHEAVRWVDERQKKNADREPGYQDRDRADTVDWVTSAPDQWFLPYDRALFTAGLQDYLALPTSDRVPEVDALLERAGSPEAWVAAAYDPAAVPTADAMVAWMGMSPKQLAAEPNPWLQLGFALERGALATARAASRAREGAALKVRGDWVTGLAASMGPSAYPDANSTLRVAIGEVVGYAPRDGLAATTHTSLSGLVAKSRLHVATSRAAAYPSPEPLLTWAASPVDADLVEPTVDDLPIAFLTDVDTTGGNSGSATLDASGRLIGLLYDGNYESMTADWVFDAALTRSIHVDVRYVLWLLRHQPEAAWILGELGQPFSSSTPTGTSP